MQPRERLLLEEMVDAAEQARTLVRGHDVADIAGDRMRRDALLWNFTVLGEASSQLPQEFREQHPDVDWVRPGRLRNRIVHGYWSVDLAILHATATDDLPRYVEQLRSVLERLTR